MRLEIESITMAYACIKVGVNIYRFQMPAGEIVGCARPDTAPAIKGYNVSIERFLSRMRGECALSAAERFLRLSRRFARGEGRHGPHLLRSQGIITPHHAVRTCSQGAPSQSGDECSIFSAGQQVESAGRSCCSQNGLMGFRVLNDSSALSRHAAGRLSGGQTKLLELGVC